jgi:hypothetical protein
MTDSHSEHHPPDHGIHRSASEPPPPPGYRDVSIPFERIMKPANALGLLMLAAALAPFVALHGVNQLVNTRWPPLIAVGIVLVIMVVLTVAHELIHAISWVWAGGLTWQNVSFGIKWKTLMPYAHINTPISARAYRWGAVMPGLLTGVIPALIALITGSGLLMLIGTMMFVGAVGDVIVLWIIQDVPADSAVLDHPSAVGCYVRD